jgi:hypothetical protein
MKRKIHEFVLKVSFDKPITHATAKSEVRDHIYGQFVTEHWRVAGDETNIFPEWFRVLAIKPIGRL